MARENKKFVFSAVKKGARARSFEAALSWLEDAGLILLAHAVGLDKQPLRHYADQNAFKVYALDVGLLGAMARTTLFNLKRDGKILNIPLYAVSQLPSFLK